jgi:hypothetical protein
MARVERGNVVLNVDDASVQHYLNLGYNLTDNTGKVLKRSIPTNLGELQTAYIQHTAKIEELEATVARLTAELNAPKPAPKKKQAKDTE